MRVMPVTAPCPPLSLVPSPDFISAAVPSLTSLWPLGGAGGLTHGNLSSGYSDWFRYGHVTSLSQ